MANARRPRTVWVDEPPNWRNQSESSPPRSNTVSADLEHAHPDLAQLERQASTRKIPQLMENPWQTYEAFIEINYARPVFLARRRTNKTELVHIQPRARQSSSIDSLLGTIGQLSHTSFPALRECYYHENRVFLVWEPVELSVSQILASKCLITESEIAAIVRPVLQSIKYLRDRGRVLATLSADTILITQSGHVKVAGIEDSCEITASEMDGATLKLYALADVVGRLMKKNPPPYRWSVEVESLPGHLRCLSVEKLLQGGRLEQSRDEGELKLLVNVANKTAYHRIESFSNRS